MDQNTIVYYFQLQLRMFQSKSGGSVITIIFLSLLFLEAFSQSKLAAILPELQDVIEKAKQNIWAEIEPEGTHWNMPPWLGSFFLSEYYFELKALQLQNPTNFQTKFNTDEFTAKLLREQLPDGSWKQIIDENQKEGSLDATIFNYWYLKEIGLDMLSKAMINARKFILDHGGIEKSQMMTKYKLASFGQYEWQLVNYVPLFLFKKTFPLYSYGYIKDYVSQWVYPHLTALAYLRYHKTIFPVSKVCLSQLLTTRGRLPCQDSSEAVLLKSFPALNGSVLHEADPDVNNLLDEAVSLIGKKGAFGGYTISTLLNLMALKDYSLRYRNAGHSKYGLILNSTLHSSLRYVEGLYFSKRNSYDGCLCDGRYWDTILSSWALLEAGEPPQRVKPSIDYLISKVQQNGGIPYGEEFEYAPDIDDTGMLLVLYGKMKKHFAGTELGHFFEYQINRTYTWTRSNQNDDGGFPAFDKNKNDDQFPLVKFLFWATKIDKSAEIFDPSCADIVGHILQGMGEAGVKDGQVFSRTLKYLHNTRKEGMWNARWGINYVYAVGAVFPGLARIGYDLRQPWIANITKRLTEVQQEDGGFGENQQGYNTKRYVKGATTASMTAWGLLAYLQAAHTTDLQDNILRAAQFLIGNFRQNGNRFWDRSVVGTGHRGILNLQYSVYALSFPLVALSRLRDYVRGNRHPYVDEALMQQLRGAFKDKQQEL